MPKALKTLRSARSLYRKPTTLAPFLSLIKLATETENEPRTSWAQVLRVGEFYDPRYGDFAVTRQDLAQMAENFKTGKYPVRPTRLTVDYNHGASGRASAEDGKAAGWIEDVELRADGDELWAKVQWTDEAAVRIEKKEYQFTSASFAFDYTNSNGGEDIGPTLQAFAICNRPVVHGMQPLALAQAGAFMLADAPNGDDEIAEALFSFDEQRRRVQDALTEKYGQPYGYAPPDYYQPYRGVYLEALYDGYAVFCNYDNDKFRIDYTIGTDGVVTFTSEPVEVRVSYEPLTASLSAEESTMKTIKTKDAKGNAIELAEETVLELAKTHGPRPAEPVELTALKQTVETQGATIVELQTQTKTLKTQNDALELAARTQKADAAVAALISAGKLDPKDRDVWHALALDNEATFKTLSATLVQKREINAQTGTAADAGAGAAKQQLDLAIDAEIKANPKLTREQAYAAALSKNPSLYTELTN